MNTSDHDLFCKLCAPTHALNLLFMFIICEIYICTLTRMGQTSDSVLLYVGYTPVIVPV